MLKLKARQETPPSPFETAAAALDIPPGPNHFAARRALWLKPPAGGRKRSTSQERARRDLEQSITRALDRLDGDEKAWRSTGLHKIWRGIVQGGVLKQRIPLPILVRILRAGWMRDGAVPTWPRHLKPPESEIEEEEVVVEQAGDAPTASFSSWAQTLPTSDTTTDPAPAM